MSGLKLKTLNGSVTLQPEDGAGDVVVPLKRGGIPLKTPEVIAWELANGPLSWDGGAYTDPDAVGANPTATIYPDGTIAGSTDNGEYIKYPNGALEVYMWGAEFIRFADAVANIDIVLPISVISQEKTILECTAIDSRSSGGDALFHSDNHSVSFGRRYGTSLEGLRAVVIGTVWSIGQIFKANIIIKGRWK